MFYIDIDGDNEEEALLAPAYVLMNVRFAQELGKSNLKVLTGINNVLNEGDPVYLPLQPRWFFVGINSSFTPREEAWRS